MKPRFLITAGPTREFLDAVRFISNRSSGKMGYELARAARRYGSVTLVSGPVALKPPAGVTVQQVTTAQEMAEAVLARFDKADIVIMAAAVCDFRPRRSASGKIKKEAFDGCLRLVPTVDILAALGKRKKHQLLVGFAAETGDWLRNAREKLHRKNLDLIVANDVRAMEAPTNRVALLYRDGRVERLPEMSKKRVAREILRRVIALRT
ncbi:MAG: phosphopantothenoylcysteine decarboxylase [Verrucomicrobiae bacterium]|nr:phosphopantothenoylcysteine decarboxylase [Verrucomicrobiae bacterium]